jgi:putative hydrolase of the HAD superfamily
MIKAITFDLDNTLIDFMKMKREASNAAAKAMVKTGVKMNLKRAQEELFTIYLKDIEGTTASRDFLLKHNAYTDRRHAAAINAYLETKAKYLKPYPGVRQTLIKLKKRGYKLAIITDAPRLNAWRRLDSLKIADIFNIVVGFEDTNRRKPSKLPFKKALKSLGFMPEEVLHVGDWPERDIKGAKKLGLKTCLAKYGWERQGKYVKPDYEIKKIEEIMKII